jgi:hypothetical protein
LRFTGLVRRYRRPVFWKLLSVYSLDFDENWLFNVLSTCSWRFFSSFQVQENFFQAGDFWHIICRMSLRHVDPWNIPSYTLSNLL